MDLGGRALLLGLRYGIGDVVMELPVLSVLRRACPAAHITAVGANPAIELLEDYSVVDEVVGMESWGITHRWDTGDEGVRASLRAWLAERHFDLFLDIHQLPPVVDEVVRSLGRPILEAAEAAECAAVRAGANAVEAIQAAVRVGWGEEFASQERPRLTCSAPERRAAESFLHEHGLAGRRLVGICPLASLELKRWPFEHFMSVADRILTDTSYAVLVFCGPHEELAQQVRAGLRHNGRLGCVGKLHLRSVAALIERCQAFVCNDTGLSHIAAALNVPTVAIFGITDPRVYRPAGPHSISVGGSVACPYRNTGSLEPPACFFSGHCLIADQGCIASVGEAEVLGALEEMLQWSENGRRCSAQIPRDPASGRAGAPVHGPHERLLSGLRVEKPDDRNQQTRA